MYFLLASLTAFSIGLLVTPILISILTKAKIGDSPGGRRIHEKFTPSMGGIGFILASFVAIAIWGWQFPLPDIKYLIGAITIIFFVGFRDDMVELKASHKLLGQLVAVILVVVVADIRIKDFYGFLGLYELNLFFSYAFSAFVLLALTNAFNLIDGIDGLAGSSAVLIFTVLGIWFLGTGVQSYALISFVFSGALIAFLFFNWRPAKIFMGDTGSLTLGFTLGALTIAFMEINSTLPIRSAWKFEPVFSAGIALMIFPLYDMARVFTKRIRRGKGPMTPDKTHVHHFLMRIGLNHNQVSLLLLGIQAFFMLLIVLFKDFSDHLVLPMISILTLVLGARLDVVTLNYVKRKVSQEPRVLEIRALKSYSKTKIKLESKDFEKTDINLN